MPITKIATVVSDPTDTWFSTSSRGDATAGAITGTPSATRGVVLDIGRVGSSWPELLFYPSVGAPNPAYVWNDNAPASPETLYFALPTYFFVASFEVVNYTTGGTISPAALQYIVELYDEYITDLRTVCKFSRKVN
ncbi:hypothetical protein [Paenibacillus prosopidis]|uniref:Uncharacterized protein n=1 Tax=Paenibacillus prosopidis TaxID=630520 RepID=A0A368WBU7_9BACL|nr:hypothetical protein [Paenibacillus prosopidis]RCW50887.1 hypothetical protein DFP97_10279 [Paenibacillus prosopidis]